MFRRGVTLASSVHPRCGFQFPVEGSVAKHFAALFRGGLVRSGSAPGTQCIMPLGQRVLEKICSLIDAEMSRVNARKMSLPILTADSLLEKSGRREEFGKSLFKLQGDSPTGGNSCLAPTHEEAITSLLATSAVSHQDLPIKLYQIGPKFRNESKTGLLRTREFLMKDCYTFDQGLDEAKATYDQLCGAYNRIFTALQLPYLQVSGDVGLMGGHASSEFQALSLSGEDTIHVCSKCDSAWNSEMTDSQGKCEGGCNVEAKKSIEIGHCFLLGTKYSEIFNTNFETNSASKGLTVMGCFGIGVTRLLATLVDTHWCDDNKLIWPKAFAPYSIHVLSLGKPRDERFEKARDIADRLSNCHFTEQDSGRVHTLSESDVLLDDRVWWMDGVRLKEAEFLGSPYLVIAGKKSNEGLYELQHQPSRSKELHTADALVERLTELLAQDQGLLPRPDSEE